MAKAELFIALSIHNFHRALIPHSLSPIAPQARLLRQNPEVDFGSEEVAAKLQFEEIDYVKWLQTFHEFWEIPRFCKYRDQAYSDYLTTFASYLEAFARKALPLQNITEILHK